MGVPYMGVGWLVMITNPLSFLASGNTAIESAASDKDVATLRQMQAKNKQAGFRIGYYTQSQWPSFKHLGITHI